MALSAIGRNAIEGEGRCRKAAPQRRSSDPGPKRHSELTQHGGKRYGAGEGNRTLTASLGSSCSTIELRPPAAAILASRTAARQWSRWWAGDRCDLARRPCHNAADVDSVVSWSAR